MKAKEIRALARAKAVSLGGNWDWLEADQGPGLETTCLSLSFLGWYILTAFTLGILGIWLMPYYNLAIAETYEQSKEDKY